MLVQQIISKMINDRREKGLKYLFDFYIANLSFNFLKYPYYKFIKKSGHFQYEEQDLDYFYHWYNITYTNERTIEIPIAIHYINEYIDGDILEVGNVLSHYMNFRHEIIDKYEKDHGVLNVDVVEYNPDEKYDLILSLSTMEHVGWDETPRDPEKVLKAIENCRKLLKNGGKFVFTLPKGYNPPLDDMIDKGRIPFSYAYYYKRISKDDRWEKTSWDDIRHVSWEEIYPYANAVIICIIENQTNI